MSEYERVVVAFRAWVREQSRRYVLLALLVFLPVYGIIAVNSTTPDEDGMAWVQLDGVVVLVEPTQAALYSVHTVAVATALVAGISGVFVVQQAKGTDRRLALAGYGSRPLVVARLLALVAVVLTVTAFAIATMLLYFQPKHLGWFALMIALSALLYGLIGMIVGSVLDTLPSLYVMLFGPVLDLRVFQNPIVTQGHPDLWTRLLPGYHPTTFLHNAAFGTAPEYESLGWVLVYLVAVALVVGYVFDRETRVAR